MNQITIVGCDLHDRNMLLKLALGMNPSHEKRFLNDQDGRLAMVEYLVEFAVKQGSDRIVFVYEASSQGYGLCDLLSDHGIQCWVLSPSHLPKSSKSKKNKTDPKDAQRLFEVARAHVLAGNELPIVWTPPQRLRNDRELVRTRLESAEACTRVKLQIMSLVKRHGIALPEWFRTNRNWTRKFVRWLKELAQKMDQVITPVLQAYVERFETLNKQIAELNKHVRALSRTDRYRGGVEAVCELPGVGLITAMTFLTEMGDLSRFSNRRQIAAFLGLSPSSFESGEADDRKGHITRQGPGRVRKVLCQAAWTAIRMDKTTRETWVRIQGNKKGSSKKAVVAIMRKLAIVMWHRAFGAGVSEELMAPPTKPPSWVQNPSLAQAG
jgi:transposase